MKWSIIGAGGIADRRTIPAILLDKENELVALMDKNPETAKKLGEKYNVPSFTDEESLLKEVESDAVYIGTPVSCHYDQALLALKYGRHVFMEKPIALNAKQGKKIADAFKKANKQLTIGYMMKHHNLHVKAKELIENDQVGQVNNVRVQFSCWYPDIKGAWRQSKKLGGGGAIMDLGVHCIELVEYLLDDEIKTVKSIYSTRTFNYEVEDGGVIVFETKGGVLGHIDVNFNIPDKASVSKLEIYGTKGYIICEGSLGQEEGGKLAHLYSPQEDYSAMQNRSTNKPTEYQGEMGNLYQKQIQYFTKQVKSNKTNYYYLDRAVQVQQIVDKIYKNK